MAVMKTTFTLLTILLVMSLFSLPAQAKSHPQLQTTDIGKIIRHYVYSPQLADTIAVDVWLPAEYGTDPDGCPVIYMHDGQNLFDENTTWNHQTWNADSIAGRLAADNVIIPPIVVGIHSDASSRVATLMPVKAVAALNINPNEYEEILNGVAPRGDEYVAFLAETLKPVIDRTYSTRPDRANTYVAGSSMGGLMSIYALCERPDIFGGAICLSTHWSGFPGLSTPFATALREYVAQKLPDATLPDGAGYIPRLYFDHGTATIDADYGQYETPFIEMLRSKGYGPQYLMTYVAQGAPHEEQAWTKRFHLPLIFMLHH